MLLTAQQGSPPNTIALAALSVSILSLTVAALALGWQIAAWLLSAGRARAQLRLGALSSMNGSLVTLPVGSAQSSLINLASEGYDIPVLAVSVTSTGRAPVTVQNWSAYAKELGISLTPVGDLIGNPMPKKLEPGETYTWAVPLHRAESLVYAGQVIKDTRGVDDIYAVVELGSGKKLRTKTSLTVRSSQ